MYKAFIRKMMFWIVAEMKLLIPKLSIFCICDFSSKKNHFPYLIEIIQIIAK